MVIWLYILAGICMAGIGGFYYFRHFEMSHIYHPVREISSTPQDIGLEYEDVYFQTSDQIKLHGWFIPFPDSKVTLLVFHGNYGNISQRLEQLKFLHKMGVNIFIFDYRGYGKSKGSVSEEGTYEDSLAAWNYLRSRKDINPYKIILFGRSLGGALAIDLAAKVRSLGLCIESTFTSIPDIGKELYPYNPINLFASIRYDSISKMGNIHCPVMICHSKQDDMIPFSHAERLFSAAHSPKEFYMLKGMHKDGGEITGDSYQKALQQFIQQCLEAD